MKKLPHPLQKALEDSFASLVVLRSGMVLEYDEGAELSEDGEWLKLLNAKLVWPVMDCGCGVPFDFDRGFYVRVSEIAACVDAPHSS